MCVCGGGEVEASQIYCLSLFVSVCGFTCVWVWVWVCGKKKCVWKKKVCDVGVCRCGCGGVCMCRVVEASRIYCFRSHTHSL